MGFNPKAFLAESKKEKGFDPKAFLAQSNESSLTAEPPAPAPPAPEQAPADPDQQRWQALVEEQRAIFPKMSQEELEQMAARDRGAQQMGTFGLRDEGAGLVEGVKSVFSGGNYMDGYRKGKAESVALDEVAEARRPDEYLQGGVVGGVANAVATAPLMPVKGAIGLMATGGLQGGLQGFGSSKADLTHGGIDEIRQAGGDTVTGMGVGATVGAALGGAGKLATGATNYLSRLANTSTANAIGRVSSLVDEARSLFGLDKHASNASVDEAVAELARRTGIIGGGATRESISTNAAQFADDVGKHVSAVVGDLDRAASANPGALPDIRNVLAGFRKFRDSIPDMFQAGETARAEVDRLAKHLVATAQKAGRGGRWTFDELWQYRKGLDKSLRDIFSKENPTLPQEAKTELRRIVEGEMERAAQSVGGGLETAYARTKAAYAKAVFFEDAAAKGLLGEGQRAAQGIQIRLPWIGGAAAAGKQAANAALSNSGTSPTWANALHTLAQGANSTPVNAAGRLMSDAANAGGKFFAAEKAKSTPPVTPEVRALRIMQEAPETLPERFRPGVEEALQSGDKEKLSSLAFSAGNDGSSEGRKLYKLLMGREKTNGPTGPN